MINVSEVCKKYSISVKKVKYFESYYLLFSNNNVYLLKQSDCNLKKLFRYFKKISYPYYLKNINSDDDSYELYIYYEDNEKDLLSKGKEIINAISYLQLKSIFYEELLEKEFNNLYENILHDIDYQMKYYLDLHDYIESFSFPRVDYYYLLLNISNIYKILQKSRYYLDLWHQKKIFKIRKCYSIHNVSFANFCFSKSSYFLDFTDCFKDFIFSDFISFYKKEVLSVDMIYLFDYYQKNIFLSEEEFVLLKAFICIPKKLVFTKNIYDNTVSIYYLLEYIENTNSFLEKYEKNQETNKDKFEE